jgi:hypothetical protein
VLHFIKRISKIFTRYALDLTPKTQKESCEKEKIDLQRINIKLAIGDEEQEIDHSCQDLHHASSMTSVMTLAAAAALPLINTHSFCFSQIFHTTSMTRESKATNLRKS